VIWILVLALVLLALAGGVAVSKLAFLLLLAALVVALLGVAGRGAA
jgi:hypothetical protein